MMRRSWSGLTFIDFDSRFNSRDCVDRTRTCQAINVCAEWLRCDPTTINTGDPATFDRSMFPPTRSWARVAWAGSAEGAGPAVRDSAARGADATARSASRWRRAAGLCGETALEGRPG